MQALLAQPEGDAPTTSDLTNTVEHGEDGRWQKVAQLLGRKYDRLDPVQALPLLPLQVLLQHFPCMQLCACCLDQC